MNDPSFADAELAALRAAVELHRPKLMDKYGQPTDDVAAAKWIRCRECSESVPADGCRTWRTAHPDDDEDAETCEVFVQWDDRDIGAACGSARPCKWHEEPTAGS